ncbi:MULTISPECIES: hypothetical protein [Calothrix]|uniref:Uncharacterized protein n=2 Tax=Calothrix TaxID=1186 RepID=A0ABR8A5L1_9CYAN|nr:MULTISPECIES: hypothetical protein [Calothrix]MBD2195272.1 hypothetical protein [Calothrix parietina FACHB-288]MBD2203686.1 hypothetical protein [Calothrix sp. FACHB-168]MBD2219992.1 hypothetical protein [Calothrix sp. FACHB-1219]MBD2223757.1 hypothetical protein [Calothrix anomala FACHB-343]
MSLELILQKNAIANQNIAQETRNDVKSEPQKPAPFSIPDVAISVTPLAVLITWLGFFILLRKYQTSRDNKKGFIIQTLRKVPCKNCQFYANNHYLKCAVQPSLVMTEEAKNCSEYSPSTNKSSSKDFFNRDHDS